MFSPPPSKNKQGFPDAPLWPAIEATIGCVRVVTPDISYDNVMFLDVELLRVTSAPDNPVGRFVVNRGAYKRMVRRTGSEGPGYQLDATSISLWGVKIDKADW